MAQSKEEIKQVSTEKIRLSFGTKSVAQSNTLCAVGGNMDLLLTKVDMCLSVDSGLSQVDKMVIELLFVHGLRISEALAINGKNITQLGAIVVKSGKNSSYRLVASSRFSEVYKAYSNKDINIFASYSRFYFYRQFTKLGLYIVTGNGLNNKVTHSGRHKLVSELKKQSLAIEHMAEVVGHKSTKSTAYYTKAAK